MRVIPSDSTTMTGVVFVCLAAAATAATPAIASPRRAAAEGAIGTARLPGGVEGIRRALGDRAAMPPATAIVELTRRFYSGTETATDQDAGFARLQTWLRECVTASACESSANPSSAVPLPGSVAFWQRSGLVEATSEDDLAPAILQSRGAALLYTALLSMEPATRAWFLDRPDLVSTLSESALGTLVVAAPYLRRDADRWQLPGGHAATPVWTDLVGVAATDDTRFLSALLREGSGHLAYMLEVVATLSPGQQAAALSPASGPASGGRALFDGLQAIVGSWVPGQRPFWRPSPDPAFLLAQIPVDAAGRLAMPGRRRFWQFVLDDDDVRPTEAEAVAAWRDSEPLSPSWLVMRLAASPPDRRHVLYQQMLFAARTLSDEPVERAAAAATAIRGYARFTPLVRVMERLGIGDAGPLAAMVRQAEALTRAGDRWRARATLAQWQAVLALVDRIAATGSLTPAEVGKAIDTLASPVAARADAVWIGWLATVVPSGIAEADAGTRPIERSLIERLCGYSVARGRLVQWEGTTYQIDFAAAERDRIARVRGREGRPLIDVAAVLASRLARSAAAPADEWLTTLASLAAAAGVDRPLQPDDEFGLRARDAATRARRRLVDGRGRPASPEALSALRDLSEALATAALVELAYAAHLGWAEDLPLSAAAASRRHVFVRPHGPDRVRVWAAPSIGADRRLPWHVSGSLLGLDAALAPIAMRRLSMRPLPASPLLNTGDRSILVTTAAVLNPRAFTDDAQRTVQSLVSRAHAIVAAVADEADARRVAAAANLSTLRAAIVEWLLASDRQALAQFFSMTELVNIGLAGESVPDELAGWGNYELALTGRPGAGRLPDRPVERYAGRSRRVLAYAVPDLQLTLAFRLAEMRLPAVLVPALMASASLDVVNTTPSRHTDDWDALVARIRAVGHQDVERYLGLLTAGGPLRAAAEAR